MKKLISFILAMTIAMTMAAVLASCGGKGNNPADTSATQNAAGPAESAKPTEPTGTTDPAGTTVPVGTTEPVETTKPAETTGSKGLEYKLNNGGYGYVVYRGECTDTDIKVPATHEGMPVTSIGFEAFYNCAELKSITIPDSVVVIEDRAFFGCVGLTSITIPDSVTDIYMRAFEGCTGLTSITIPASVTVIDFWAFAGCTGLTSMTVAVGNPVYHSVGNCLIETEKKMLNAGCKTSVIPSDGSVTVIGVGAFSGCTGLTSVTIPDVVTDIYTTAFLGCTGLTSITIPDSVTEIGRSAFIFCTSLTDIYYGGTEAQWAELDGDLSVPDTATVHYNSHG